MVYVWVADEIKGLQLDMQRSPIRYIRAFYIYGCNPEIYLIGDTCEIGSPGIYSPF